jgi:hypothetical protein
MSRVFAFKKNVILNPFDVTYHITRKLLYSVKECKMSYTVKMRNNIKMVTT